MIKTIQYQYDFILNDDKTDTLVVTLDATTLEQIKRPVEQYPEWTTLTKHQCTNCPLQAEEHPQCPVAVSLLPLQPLFKDLVSFETLNVVITTPERTIKAATTVQRSISSILGLLMATSSCPRLYYFRPMARFHLPLASEEETIYRSAAMYLLAQYFVGKEGGEADLSLSGLTDVYKNMQLVNRSLAERLRDASEYDGAVNAVVLLDLFAKALPFAIDESLEELRYLFKPFIDRYQSSVENEID